MKKILLMMGFLATALSLPLAYTHAASKTQSNSTTPATTATGAATNSPGTQSQLKAQKLCPDPAIVDLKVSASGKNADGTYWFRLVATIKNVGNATFESARRQTQFIVRESTRAVETRTFSSDRGDVVSLMPGQSYAEMYVVKQWNATGKFLSDFSAEIAYTADVPSDNNPKNNDCGPANNLKAITVSEIRTALGVAP